MAIRGTAEQLKLASFLLSKLDPTPNRAYAEMTLSAPDDVVRVHYFPDGATRPEMQEGAALLRATAWFG